MSKEIYRALPLGFGLLLIAVVLGLPSGCSEKTPTTATSSVPAKLSPAAHQSVAFDPKPMLDGWAKPAVAIVLSGEQHGYMEPCGCSATQSGGLSRRGDFFRQLGEKGWQYTSFDLGGLVGKDNLQNKLKFQEMLAALKDLGYKALAIGKEELELERLDSGFLLVRATEASANGEAPAFLSANVEFPDFKDTPAVTPTKVVTIAGHKIGVTAIFGAGLKAEVLGEVGDPKIAVKDPAAALPAAIAQLKKEQAEILVLLAHANRDEALALAKKFPEFDLVVTAGPEDGNNTPERLGKTLFVEVGMKGKHVAVVGYYPDNKEKPLRFELVDLDKYRFNDTPKMIDHMRAYQHMLEASYDTVMQDLPKSRAPSGDVYAGVETCKDCHKKAYGIWKDTKHAHAFESLITGREGTKDPVRRDHDPECLSCHTTGWEPQQFRPYESGFYSEQKTPHLKEQQCENCHGPCTEHNRLEELWKKDPKSVKNQDLLDVRKRIKLSVATVENTLCVRCHDYENDPNFNHKNFNEYWEQIKHPGKD